MKVINLKKKLLFSLFYILLLFLLLEIFLRIAGIEYPIFQKHDKIRGFSLLPNASGVWKREGEGKILINSEGLRDIEHNFSKAEGVFRIAILGDSFAEARAVNLEDTFWFKLKKNLNQCKKNKFKKLEIINFGVSEYGTTQQYLTLKNYVWQYDPDLILLAFFTENDVADNSKILSKKKYRPYYFYKNNNLLLDDSFTETKPYKILSSVPGKLFIQVSQYSRIAQLFRESYVQYYFKSQNDNLKKKSDTKKLVKSLEIKNLYEPKEKVWLEAWAITEEIIKRINNDILSKNKDFILVTLSNPMQVHPNKRLVDKYLKNLNIKNLNYPDQRLEDFASKNDIKYINTAKKLNSIAIESKVFFHGFNNTKLGTGHWNKNGHDTASKIISSGICNFY